MGLSGVVDISLLVLLAHISLFELKAEKRTKLKKDHIEAQSSSNTRKFDITWADDLQITCMRI